MSVLFESVQVRSRVLDLDPVPRSQPKEMSVVAVKSTIHFRADFDAIAKEIIMVEAPGANFCRNEKVVYKNLRSGVRINPSGLIEAA